MGSFMPVVQGLGLPERKVFLQVPMVIPAGAEYDILVYTPTDNDKSCYVRDHDGNVLVEITHSGQVIVLDGGERRQLN